MENVVDTLCLLFWTKEIYVRLYCVALRRHKCQTELFSCVMWHLLTLLSNSLWQLSCCATMWQPFLVSYDNHSCASRYRVFYHMTPQWYCCFIRSKLSNLCLCGCIHATIYTCNNARMCVSACLHMWMCVHAQRHDTLTVLVLSVVGYE